MKYKDVGKLYHINSETWETFVVSERKLQAGRLKLINRMSSA